MTDFRDRLNFALQGSLVDVIGKAIPNYERSSPLWLEKEVGGQLTLANIAAHNPVFLDNGTIYLQGNSINEVTFNTDIYRNDWVKGENVTVQRDEAKIPSNRTYGDRAIFAGDPSQVTARNTMYREFLLAPHTEYTFSIMLRQWNGEFVPSDHIKITNNVLAASTISLYELNDFPQQYQIKTAEFTTGGTSNIGTFAAAEWEIVNVVGNTYTLEITNSTVIEVAVDELLLSRLLVEDNGFFTIAGNTAKLSGDNQIEIVIDDYGDLTPPVVNDTVTLVDAEEVLVRVEMVCESAVVFDVGTMQIEPNSYRSSFNFQFDTVKSTDLSRLEYELSPISQKSNFALLIEVEYWRGKVNLFDTDNLKIWAEAGTLYLDIAGVISQQPQLPQGFTLLLNCVNYKSQVQIYLDGKLIAIDNQSFTGAAFSRLNLTQDSGVLALKRLVCLDGYLVDGDIPVLANAESEVAELLAATDLIEASTINQKLTEVNLPQVVIPAASEPDAQTFISNLNSVTKTLQVDNTTGFAIDDPVTIVRYKSDEVRTVLDTTVVNVDAGTGLIRLDSVQDVQQEDYLIKGTIAQPGKASVRFPNTAIDNQTIEVIFEAQNELQLNSVTAFVPGRAFVQDESYRAIAEIRITEVDNANKRVTVDRLEGLEVDHVIYQPNYETIISPSNYFAKLVQEVDRVTIAHQYKNGLLLQNYNPFPVRVNPMLVVAL